MKTSWAILLTKFTDSTDEPYPKSRYEEIFTSSGEGKWSMPDFFRDMSHGKVDLSGSQVFGWYTLKQKLADYKGTADIITWAREAATQAGVHLENYFNVVVVLNGPWALFGAPSGAAGGDDGKRLYISGICPSTIGQEMGHGYGLDHSRSQGSVADYMDRFDIMSTMGNAAMAPHPVYTEAKVRDGSPVFLIGPGLNAANMHGRGWLDAARTWTAPAGTSISTTIELRPLHRRDLPGWLAARVGDLFIEFRGGEGWDAGFPSTVMVHRYEGNRSYLQSSDDGEVAMGPGSKIKLPPSASLYGSEFLIEVVAIDAGSKNARVKVVVIPEQVPEYERIPGPFRTPWIKWWETKSYSDLFVVLDGQLQRIERDSPLHAILKAHTLYEDGVATSSPELGLAVRHAALANLNLAMENMIASLSRREPAPEAFFDALVAETRSEDTEAVQMEKSTTTG